MPRSRRGGFKRLTRKMYRQRILTNCEGLFINKIIAPAAENEHLVPEKKGEDSIDSVRSCQSIVELLLHIKLKKERYQLERLLLKKKEMDNWEMVF
jgi:hypothetical protein